MELHPRVKPIIVIIILISVSTLIAETPSDNTIPTLPVRIPGPDVSYEDITLELLCELSWLSFDAVNFAGWAFITQQHYHDFPS